MGLTVYKIDASPPVRAVLMTVEALKIKNVEFVDINLLTGDHLREEYVKMNPQHTVPTLKDDDFVVWDSHAIAAYLVSKYGSDPSLYPSDPKKRAIVDQRLHFDTGILFTALRETVKPIFFGSETSFRPENIERIKSAYDFSEKFLEKQSWFAGDNMTIADICAVSSISTLNVLLPVDAAKYPNIDAWLNRCSKLDFYIKANLPGLQMFAGLLKSKLA